MSSVFHTLERSLNMITNNVELLAKLMKEKFVVGTEALRTHARGFNIRCAVYLSGEKVALRAQALQITGEHENVLHFIHFISLFLARTQVSRGMRTSF